MDKPPRIRLGALSIVAARPRELGRFYSKLLNWPYIREEEPGPGEPPDAGYALVCPPDGVAEPTLNFGYDPNHRRPVWPTIPGETDPGHPPRRHRRRPRCRSRVGHRVRRHPARLPATT